MKKKDQENLNKYNRSIVKVGTRKHLVSMAINLRSMLLKLDAGQKVTVIPNGHFHKILRWLSKFVDYRMMTLLRQMKRRRKKGTSVYTEAYERSKAYLVRKEALDLMEKYFSIHPYEDEQPFEDEL